MHRDDRSWFAANKQGASLQVIYVLEIDNVVFVIHARPLTDSEKHRLEGIEDETQARKQFLACTLRKDDFQ